MARIGLSDETLEVEPNIFSYCTWVLYAMLGEPPPLPLLQDIPEERPRIVSADSDSDTGAMVKGLAAESSPCHPRASSSVAEKIRTLVGGFHSGSASYLAA